MSSLPIKTITRSATYPSGWHLAKSGIGTVDSLPFGFVVVRGHSSEFLVCGSAASETIDDAIQKARYEAFMMLDGILNSDRVIKTSFLRLFSVEAHSFT